MNPSLYAALLGLPKEEAEGAAVPADPPEVETGVEVAEPPPDSTPEQHILKTAFEAGTKPDYDAMEASMSTAAPMPKTDTDVVREKLLAPEPVAEPAKPSLRSLADKYGLSLEDMLPPQPRGNDSRLASDLGRAGNTLGAALAGVKPDHSFYDNIEKRGAADAAAMDARGDSFTKFKQALMLKVAEDKAAKKSKYDPALADPNSPEFKAREAAIKSTTSGRLMLQRYYENAKASGVAPDLNQIDAKISNFGSWDQSGQNAQMTDTRTRDLHEDQKAYDQLKRTEEYNRSLTKLGLEDDLKQRAEMRHANVPDYVPAKDATPTAEDAQKVKLNNFKSAKVLNLLDEMKGWITQHQDVFARINPLDDPNSELSVIYGKLRDAYRVAEDFGVPSGNDMNLIADVVKDPRKLLNAFTGRDAGAYDALRRIVSKEQLMYAQSRGYVPANGATQGPASNQNIVRSRILGEGQKVTPPAGGPAPTVGPASAQPVEGDPDLKVGDVFKAADGKTYRWDGDSWELP